MLESKFKIGACQSRLKVTVIKTKKYTYEAVNMGFLVDAIFGRAGIHVVGIDRDIILFILLVILLCQRFFYLV